MIFGLRSGREKSRRFLKYDRGIVNEYMEMREKMNKKLCSVHSI